MTHVGFTGTRRGMTFLQRRVVNGLVWRVQNGEAHHGCCEGADTEFHAMAYDAECRLHGHPPTNPVYRAALTFRSTDIVHTEKPYIDRNRDIIDACEALIAAPGEADEQLRSGTWSTIRYARKLGRRILIVRPDGTVVEEKGR